MGLKEMSSERLLVEFDGSIHVAIKLLGKDTTSEIEGIKTELLSRLEAGQKAIATMEQIDKLWQSNLTQDEFDKQLVVILLKYKENK